MRSGYVRTTTTDVYKGVDAGPGERIEYETAPTANGAVLLFFLLLAGGMIFIVLHAAEIQALIFG